ncbi:hypothetical protein ACFL6I_29395 [candidate division KSB1 bacterium]
MYRTDFDDYNKLLFFFFMRQDSEPFFVKGTIIALLSLSKPLDYVNDVSHLVLNERRIDGILNYFESMGLIRSFHPYTIRRKWHKITNEGITFYQEGGFKYDFNFNLAC